ncbi:MAG: hypothetical protein HY077_18570 [Elusimicrobia bacterium]|nr:hypothetical protein [Elusimicrobiota bacterium]
MTKTRWLLSLALFLGSAGFFQPVDYENTKSRWMLLRSVVDEGRLNIDSYHRYTVDKSFSDGHYYSLKGIGLPLVAAPFYWILRHSLFVGEELVSAATLLADPRLRYLIIVATVSLPFAFLGVLLFDFMLLMAIPARTALWAVLSYGFGTIALNNATIFSGHETSAFFAFAAFFILFRLGRGFWKSHRLWPMGFLAGLSAGLAVLCDYTATFIAVPLTVYALTLRISNRVKAGFVAGAGFCSALLAAYNRACFGSPFILSYARPDPHFFVADPYHGIKAFSWPDPTTPFFLFGGVSKGLFFISPVLLYALPGLALLARRRELRREFYVITLSLVLVLVELTCIHGWDGGVGFGPRYVVPVLPLLALPAALSIEVGPLFLSLLALSVFQVACAQLGWPHVQTEIQNPIFDIILPLMRQGVVAYTWLGKTGIVSHLAGGVLEYCLAAVLAVFAFQGSPMVRRKGLTQVWKLFLGSWALYIVILLCIVRTRSPTILHWQRAQAMHEYASGVMSAEMERKARLEVTGGRISETSPAVTNTAQGVFPGPDQ